MPKDHPRWWIVDTEEGPVTNAQLREMAAAKSIARTTLLSYVVRDGQKIEAGQVRGVFGRRRDEIWSDAIAFLSLHKRRLVVISLIALAALIFAVGDVAFHSRMLEKIDDESTVPQYYSPQVAESQPRQYLPPADSEPSALEQMAVIAEARELLTDRERLSVSRMFESLAARRFYDISGYDLRLAFGAAKPILGDAILRSVNRSSAAAIPDDRHHWKTALAMRDRLGLSSEQAIEIVANSTAYFELTKAFEKLTDGSRPSNSELMRYRDNFPILRPVVLQYMRERAAAQGR